LSEVRETRKPNSAVAFDGVAGTPDGKAGYSLASAAYQRYVARFVHFLGKQVSLLRLLRHPHVLPAFVYV